MKSGPSSNPDVIVVGNGPVGATAALLLARHGVQVLIVDARTEQDDAGSRAICQHRDVLDVWNEIGIGQELADEGVTLSCARTFVGTQEIVNIPLEQETSRFPRFVNISQLRTEQLLARELERSDRIEQRFGARVTGLEQDSHRVTVEIEASAEPLTAPFVLLATGPSSSALRATLGIDFEGQSYDDRFLICDIRTSAFDGEPPERRFYFDPAWNPGRQVLIHPCPDQVYRIDWQVPADFDLEGEARNGGLDRRIAAILGQDAEWEIVWQSLYRFHGRCASRFRVDRVLLAGDCAHLMAPFGARGLNSGVHDAENAAWKLAFIVRGLAGEQLLESYHLERRAAALENLRITEKTMRFLVPQTEQDRKRRSEILERAVHDEEARQQVDSGKLYQPFQYRDSPLNSDAMNSPAMNSGVGGFDSELAAGDLLPDWIDDQGEALRSLARRSLLFLASDNQAAQEARAAWKEVAGTDALVQPTFRTGLFPHTLLIRPDAHVAASFESSLEPEALREAMALALRRLLCRPSKPL